MSSGPSAVVVCVLLAGIVGSAVGDRQANQRGATTQQKVALERNVEPAWDGASHSIANYAQDLATVGAVAGHGLGIIPQAAMMWKSEQPPVLSTAAPPKEGGSTTRPPLSEGGDVVVVPAAVHAKQDPAGNRLGGSILWLVTLIVFALLYFHLKSHPPRPSPGNHELLAFEKGQWRFGFFSCLSAPELSLFTCCCFAVRWSDTIRMANILTFVHAFLLVIAATMLLSFVGALNKTLYYVMYFLIVCGAVHFRQRIRRMFNLPYGNCSTITEDFFAYACCGCLAAVQEARQLEEAYQAGHPAVAIGAQSRDINDHHVHVMQQKHELRIVNVLFMLFLIIWQLCLLDQFSVRFPASFWDTTAIRLNPDCQSLFDLVQLSVALCVLIIAIELFVAFAHGSATRAVPLLLFVEEIAGFGRFVLGLWGIWKVLRLSAERCQDCYNLYAACWWIFILIQVLGVVLNCCGYWIHQHNKRHAVESTQLHSQGARYT